MLSNSIRRAKIIKNAPPLLSALRGKAAYEGEGKTTVRVINQEAEAGLMIDTYATYGFKLNNGLTVLGPMAIFPKTVLSWQVSTTEEITEQSLRLFKLLEPKIDLLVIGLDSGDRSKWQRVFQAARVCGLNVEVLPTEHACSTFNFLNSEASGIFTATCELHVTLTSRKSCIAQAEFTARLAFRQRPDINRRAVAHQTQHSSGRRILPFLWRSVAGAMIPPSFIPNINEDDMLQTKLHYHDVFNKPLM